MFSRYYVALANIVSHATLSTWENLKDKNAKDKMVRFNCKNLLLILRVWSIF